MFILGTIIVCFSLLKLISLLLQNFQLKNSNITEFHSVLKGKFHRKRKHALLRDYICNNNFF